MDERDQGLVMIVEDEVAIRESLGLALEMAGYRTVAFANGLDAINWLKQNKPRPSVILLDLMMPVMDGWEFDQALGELPEIGNIPVIVVTACSGAIEFIRHAKEIIRKPVDLDVLIDSVSRVTRASA